MRQKPSLGPILVPGLGLLSLGLLCACVAVAGDDTLLPEVSLEPIVIPLPQNVDSDGVLGDVYDSALERLRRAHADKDLATMRALLAAFLRDDAPPWAHQRLLGFRGLAAGLQFELFAAAEARLVPAPLLLAGPLEADCIGRTIAFDLVLPPMPGAVVRLGGSHDQDPVTIRFDLRVHDEFVDGSRRDHEHGDNVRLDAAIELREELRLPIRLDLGLSSAVRREVHIGVELLPGYVDVSGERAPVRRTGLVQWHAIQWPAGHAAVRRAPLATLRAAMQRGDAAHWPHVRLAAEFAPAAEREAVLAALIEWVRLGSPEQAIVAMATMAATGAASVPVGDREAWLAWWETRR